MERNPFCRKGNAIRFNEKSRWPFSIVYYYYCYYLLFQLSQPGVDEMSTSYLLSEASLPDMVYWPLKSVIALVAVLGNGVVMWLICTRRRLHCTANWFVLSLASADFCTGLIVTPSELFCLWKAQMCIWPLKVRASFYNYPINVSIYCLCVLTFDRYFYVLRPLQYTRCMTSKLIVGLISTSWMFPGILTFGSLLWLEAPNHIQEEADKVYILTQIFLVSFLPSIFLVYSYIRILFAAMKQRRLSVEHITQLRFNEGNAAESRRNQSRRRRERSSTVKVLGAVIAFFVLCWIPSVCRAVCGTFHLCNVSEALVKSSRLLILLNSGINFVVYAFLKKDIREELYYACKRPARRSKENILLVERSSRASSESNRNSIRMVRWTKNLQKKTLVRKETLLARVFTLRIIFRIILWLFKCLWTIVLRKWGYDIVKGAAELYSLINSL